MRKAGITVNDLRAVALPRWARVAAVVGLVVLLAGAGVFIYRLATRPVTLTLAAGSLDGEAADLMSAIASQLASTSAKIRLKIVDTGDALEASKVLLAGASDLAIVRGDVGDLAAARTVVLLTHGVVMIVVPPGTPIDSVDKLKDKTVGVIGEDINRGVIASLTREYDLGQAKVHFKGLTPTEVHGAIQSKDIDALLVVAPISENYLSAVRGFYKRQKRSFGLIPIESADAISAAGRVYESYELP